MVAATCGPTLADASAFVRPADPTPGPPAGRRAQPCEWEKPSVAGAAGSATLASHFGASLEDHGPNVVLYRAGPQTARRAGSLRGHDHSRQSSATPKPLHRPLKQRVAMATACELASSFREIRCPRQHAIVAQT